MKKLEVFVAKRNYKDYPNLIAGMSIKAFQENKLN